MPKGTVEWGTRREAFLRGKTAMTITVGLGIFAAPETGVSWSVISAGTRRHQVTRRG